WGQNFCKERKKRLKQIKVDCTQGDGRCSGYGENCDDQLDADPTNVRDFLCSTCARHCGLYKRWIERKKIEFTKQSGAYDGQKNNYVNEQKQKCQKESGKAESDNGFCVTGGKCNKAAEFLEKLGPCKKENGKDHEEDEINFSQPDVTFRPATNCKPCSEFKIDCEKAKCTSGDTKVGCNGNNRETRTITANHIGNGRNSAEDIDMLVSDNGESGFNDDGLEEACKDKCIFEGIRKEQWECGTVCGYNVCKPKNVNGQNGDGTQNENQIIIIRALFKRWLEYFLQDYNKIKHKISQCTKTDQGSKCENKCEEKCKKCAQEWLKLKKAEWEKIKEHYEKQKPKNGDNNMKSLVTDILGALQPQTDVDKAIKPCKSLEKFQNSTDCTVAGSSEKENGKKRDVVVCLIEKLETEVKNCANEPSDENQTQTCEGCTPVEDDEEQSLEETEENTVGNKAPAFCEIQEKKEEEESGCKRAEEPPKEPVPEADGEEQTDQKTEAPPPK
ncbi:hypothetical protein PFTANZ_04051, partial [Plasmodium falciparum Tanzania (2000708)]